MVASQVSSPVGYCVQIGAVWPLYEGGGRHPEGDRAGPTRQLYEVAGVRSKTVATLPFVVGFRTVFVSQVGVVPDFVQIVFEQSFVGPGIEFVYQPSQSTAGAAIWGIEAAAVVTPIVVPSGSLE